MPVDSYKYLPRSFRPLFETLRVEFQAPVWAPLTKPLDRSTVAVLSSAGIYLKDTQQPFDVARERREPGWGDPTWRPIPRHVAQAQIEASHLHINTENLKRDAGVALGLKALAVLESEGVIGRLAEENYSVMGYQEKGCRVWQSTTGPEIAERLHKEGVDALLLAPA